MPLDRLHPDFATPLKQPLGPVVVNRSIAKKPFHAWICRNNHPISTLDNERAVANNTPTLAPDQYGQAWNFDGITENYQVLSNFSGFGDAKNSTFIIARRPLDTTLRNSSAWGVGVGGAERFHSHMPYSNGIVYFDYGGSRITWGGYSKNTGTLDIFAFKAGDSGISIWYNGQLRASSATPATRTHTRDDFYLNNGAQTSGDFQQIHMAALFQEELPDALLESLTRDPYQIFKPAIQTPLFAPSAATVTGTGAATFPTFTAAGVGEREAVGTGAANFAAFTASGSGVRASVGTGAATFAPFTAAGSGVRTSVGTGAATFAVFTAAGSGSTPVDLEGLTVVGSAPRLRISGSAPTIKASGKPPL